MSQESQLCSDSKYAKDLVQVQAKTISLNPEHWKCAKTGARSNLWLNLSDGYIGGGRRFFDGSGGSNGALDHYSEMKAQGKEYPLVVKLDTITTKAAWVYSYAHDEDDTVNDPFLIEHLAHWGMKLPNRLKRKGDRNDGLTRKMYKDRKFSDVLLCCGSFTIPAHRAVIAAASAVFDKMLGSDMQEAREAKIKIDDFAPEIVEAMVCHVYTSEVPKPVDVAQLFGIAKKYEIDCLADDMAEKMLEDLTTENVLERCRTVRRHASIGDVAAADLWEKLYTKIRKDEPLTKTLVELAVS